MAYISIDIRKQVILKAVVNDYVQTAEPVGSSAIAQRYHLGVKSATIRSEMAELANLGFLCQPHTSAGRIPSDMGYRYFVDRLMDAVAIGHISEALLQYEHLKRQTEVEAIIAETCRLLSNISSYTSVATSPILRDSVISQVHVASIGGTRLLVVMVMDSGRVLHQFANVKSRDANLHPERLGNYLSDKLAGKSVLSACGLTECLDASEFPEFYEVLCDVVEYLKSQCGSDYEADVHMEGSNYIMQQPEFKDIERLEAVLSVLEERKALCEVLAAAYRSPDVTVLIGSENPVSGMRDCSFVGASYRIRNKIAGTIGVLGPTRMDYPRAVSSVSLIARSLGDLLTSLSIP